MSESRTKASDFIGKNQIILKNLFLLKYLIFR